MEKKNKQVKVGVSGILLKEGKLLMYKRNKSLGRGLWELPGGKLEFGENLKDCIVREFKEETGLDVKVEKLVSIAPSKTYGKHYIIFSFLVSLVNSEQKAELLEPDTHQKLEWFNIDNIPVDLFIATENALRDFKNGKDYPSL